MGLDASDLALASGAMAASPLLCTGCRLALALTLTLTLKLKP